MSPEERAWLTSEICQPKIPLKWENPVLSVVTYAQHKHFLNGKLSECDCDDNLIEYMHNDEVTAYDRVVADPDLQNKESVENENFDFEWNDI